MGKHKKKKPEIRFKGFTDDWEQRKLSDITFLSGKKNKDNLPYKSYSITNENGFVPQDEKFENGGTMHEADKRMYYIVSPNSFTYNPARINVGSIGYQNTSDNVIVSSLYEVFKTTDDVDDCFLWHWVKSDNFQQLIAQLQEGGVRLYFYYDKLCMGKIMLPNLDEQQRIGHCLDKLDNLITLHQRKLNKLKKVKKSMLEKMFPQNGEKEPQIRFCGFNSTWEQRKISEIATEKLSNGIMNNQTNDETGLRHINVINMYDQDKIHPEKMMFSAYDEETVKKCNVEPGDIFLTRSSLKPEGIAEANVLLDSGRFVYDDHLIRLKITKEKYDSFFVKLNLSGGYFKRQFIIRAKTTAFTTIGQDDIAECSGFFPVKEEQERIGSCFTNIDNLITLHQRKLEKLKKIKKAMLEKMFV